MIFMAKRPLSTKIIERIPQTVYLRSGIFIQLRHRHDNREFWRVFTSSEYMSFIPNLISLEVPSISVLDCGACIGLFSLLIEHLCRVGVLPWDKVFYTLIEPSPYNFSQLEHNIKKNLSDGSYQLIRGLVGLRGGEANFYESKRQPTSSSLINRKDLKEEMTKIRVPFIDITTFLQAKPCLVKVDIEGAEFTLFETYQEAVSNADGLIVEWHCEMGDVRAGESILEAIGLRKVKQSVDKGNRPTALYMRS